MTYYITQITVKRVPLLIVLDTSQIKGYFKLLWRLFRTNFIQSYFVYFQDFKIDSSDVNSLIKKDNQTIYKIPVKVGSLFI